MFANLVTETTYLFRNRFSSVNFFASYASIWALKFLVPCWLIFFHVFKKVCCAKVTGYSYNLDQEKRDAVNRQYKRNGLMLYIATPLTYYTGVFRIFGAKNFAIEVGLGFLFDFVFLLALLFL